MGGDALVGGKEKGPDRVLVGTSVALELVDGNGSVEPLVLAIVEDKEADFDAGRLGISTPMARAIIGRQAGSDVPYVMGDIRHVHIKSIAWTQRREDAESAAEQRRSAVEEARRRAVRTLSENVATSMNNKWGSYDLPERE